MRRRRACRHLKLRAADVYRVLGVEKLPYQGWRTNQEALFAPGGGLQLAPARGGRDRHDPRPGGMSEHRPPHDGRTVRVSPRAHSAVEPGGETSGWWRAAATKTNQSAAGSASVWARSASSRSGESCCSWDNLGQQRAYASAQRRQMVKSGLGGWRCRAGSGAAERREPDRDSAPHTGRSRWCVLDREPEAAGFQRTRSQPRDNRRESDCQRYSQRAALRRTSHAADALQAANASLEARVAERTAALERELRIAENILSQARRHVDGPLIGDSAAVSGLREAVARGCRLEPSRFCSLVLRGPARKRWRTPCTARQARKGALIFGGLRRTADSRAGSRRAARDYLAGRSRSRPSSSLPAAARSSSTVIHDLPRHHQRELEELLESRPGRRGVRRGAGQRRTPARVDDPEALHGGMSASLPGIRREIMVPALKDRRGGYSCPRRLLRPKACKTVRQAGGRRVSRSP